MLCFTCRNCHAIEYAFQEKDVLCLVGRAFRVRGRVTKCSMYEDRRVPEEHSLFQQAWTLKTDLQGRKVGFEAPVTRKREPYP